MSDENKNQVRVRLAPSPTGALHVGTARTALFNFLFARKNNGIFILRIEDTDPERSKKKWEKDILKNLKWLGLNWDEGPTLESEESYRGEYGPYRQSRRLNFYKKYLEKLLEEDKAYYCFCSEEELEAQKERQIREGEPPRYTGKCRNLSEKQVEKNLEEGKSGVIRLKNLDQKREIEFKDEIRGDIKFESRLLGDFALAKDLKNPLYNFAVVVDDYEMNISHVIRGEDHISNTPKQILIREALGFKKSPVFAHLPLILGEDESKLSKRHGAVSITEYKEEGYLPEALNNFMAFLGWNPGTQREVYSLSSLIKEFSLKRVQKGGSQFNLEKLEWMNGHYIRKKPLDELVKLCVPYLIEAGLIKEIKKSGNNSETKEVSGSPEKLKLFDQIDKFVIKETGENLKIQDLKNMISLYQERLKKISEITELIDFFFKEKLDYERDLLKWKDMTEIELSEMFDKLKELLTNIERWNQKELEEVLMPEAEKVGDRGKMLWPLRAALTGKEQSAGPFEIAEVLGKEKTLKRIEQAKDKVI